MNINKGENLEKYSEQIAKEIFGKSTNELFFQLNSEIKEQFDNIKEKFLEKEFNLKKEIFIESILVDIEEEYKYLGFYYPVIENSNNIYEENYDEILIEDVYVNMKYSKLNEIEEEIFDGWLHTENGIYKIEIKLEKNKKYENKIKRFYNCFDVNGYEWNTINMAHFKRMYSLKLININFEMPLDMYRNIINGKYEIEIDFREYENKIIRNKKLLWNVEEKKLISSFFVKPTHYTMSYEYTLNINEGEQILIENNEKNNILFCYLEDNKKLNIISLNKNENIWNVFSIKDIKKCEEIKEINRENVDEENIEEKSYFSFNNYKDVNFLEKLRKKYKNNEVIKSKYDIEKKFLQYPFIRKDFVIKEIIVKDIENEEENNDIEEIYNCNDFIQYDINSYNKNKIINIYLKCKNIDDYVDDKMSFIISELGKNMGDYKIRGYINE